MCREARNSAPSYKHATGKTVSYKQVMEAPNSYCKPEGFLWKRILDLDVCLFFQSPILLQFLVLSVQKKVTLSLGTLWTHWRKCTTVQFILNHQYQMEASGQLNAPDHLPWEMAHCTHQSWDWVSPKPVQYIVPCNTYKIWTHLFIFSSFTTWCQ